MVKHLPQQLHDGDVHITEGFGGFALGGEHPTRPQDPATMLEKAAIEQAFCGTSRIRTVHQNNVVTGVGRLRDPCDAVTHRQMKTGVRPRRSTDSGQMFAAELDHAPVDFHEVEMGDTVVTQTFPCGTAITTTDHQDSFDRLGTAQGRMHQ